MRSIRRRVTSRPQASIKEPEPRRRSAAVAYPENKRGRWVSENSEAFDKAVELLQSGEGLAADETMRQAVEDAREQYGEQSGTYAHTCFERASILSGLGRTAEAVEVLRQATSVHIPDDYQITRNRLTYLMELGSGLVRLGEFDEAQKVLTESVTQREAFYGREHAGYGFGLEPLAVLKIRMDQLPEALELIDQTIDIFWQDGHPRIATALPQRAIILARMNSPVPVFPEMDDVPENILADLVQQTASVLDQQHAAASQRVLDDLIGQLSQQLGSQHNLVLQLQGFLAHVQRWIGPSEGRIESLERLCQSLLDQGRRAEATEALMALAEACEALQDYDAADTAFENAFQCATEEGQDALRSNVARNWGIFLDQTLNDPRAEEKLKWAVQLGESADDPKALGTGLVALGIYMQHQGNLKQAEPMLQRGLSLLPPADVNYVCGQSHLQAIQSGDSCGCGDADTALTDALREHILRTVPEGLLNDVQVTTDEQGLHVQVDFDHELDEQEMQLFQSAMQQAQIDFQNSMKRDQ